jgi:signal transduction histidine kinase/ActR/RegA family two-component response regulator
VPFTLVSRPKATGFGKADSLTTSGRRRLLLAAFGVGLLFVAGAAAVLAALLAADAEAWVTHTMDVRQVAGELLADVEAAQAGYRSYLLTEDKRFLHPYETALPKLSSEITRLRDLTSDNTAQQRRLAELEAAINSISEGIRQNLTLADQGQGSRAIASVKSATGEAAMDEIKARISAFSEAELTLLHERQATASNLRFSIVVLLVAALAVALGVALFLARSVQHFVNDLRRYTTELERETERRRISEATLVQAQKTEAIGQLAGGLAHDLNNMLTVIIGGLDTAQRRLKQGLSGGENGDVAAPVMKPLDMALQGARNAAQLTHRLLAFGRRQALQPTALDVNRLVAGMSELLRRTVGETINVETVLAGGLWAALSDANQLENALLNLVVNARDAMPEGGHVTIETANAYLDDAYAARFGDVVAGQYVLLSVSDTGKGIPPELLPKVFEPFFTTKPEGQGSGLGLAMVHGFVKQSGGHVRVYSEVDEGTTVKIYLPRLRQTEVRAAPIDVSPDTTARAQGSECILLVEDNSSVREFTRSALEELGYSVIESGDGTSALRVVMSATHLDLLFTDVVLQGGTNGRELARKALERRPNLPVLFTTGYSRNAIAHQGRLDEDVHLLVKPYTQQDLARKIRVLLDAYRSKTAESNDGHRFSG